MLNTAMILAALVVPGALALVVIHVLDRRRDDPPEEIQQDEFLTSIDQWGHVHERRIR